MMSKPALQIGIAKHFHDNNSVLASLAASTTLISTADKAVWGDDICVFRLPEYLRRRWWDVVAGEMLEESIDRPNFHDFVESFKDFAFFKNIPISISMEFDMLVRAPGEHCGVNNDIEMLGVINLGDERTSVVIAGELISLEVGDGCWAPKGYSILLADTSLKTDLDVLFIINDSNLVNTLQQSVSIHNFINDDPFVNRVSLSHGVCLAEGVDKTTEYVESAYIPLMPWREPNEEELSRLFNTKLPDTHVNTIGILTVPADVIESFSSLKLFESSNQNDLQNRINTEKGKLAISRATQFARSLTLDDNDLEMKVIYNDPNLLTTTHLPGEYQYMGLHIDYTHQQSIFTRNKSSNRISINLSNEDRYFLFVNLTLSAMIRLIKPGKSCTSDELSRRFFEKYPNYPVTRLRVAPGEAYIAPTQNIIHDGIGPKNSPDIHLTFCGYIDLHKVKSLLR